MKGATCALTPLLVASVILAGAATFLAPSASAQLPELPEGDEGSFYAVSMQATPASLTVPYRGTVQSLVTIRDVSATSSTPVANPVPLYLRFEAEVVDNEAGWSAGVAPSSQTLTSPGAVHQIGLVVVNDGLAQDPYAQIRLNVTYVAPDQQKTFPLDILVQVAENPFVQIVPETVPPTLNPDGIATLRYRVSNFDQYPDLVQFEVTAPAGWTVFEPSPIALFPGNSTEIAIDVKAPQDTLWTFGESGSVVVTAVSTNDPRASHTATVPVRLQGGWVPPWFLTMLAFVAVGMIVAGKRLRDRSRDRSEERSNPEYPGIPPEEQAALLVLKRTDPERYQQRQEQLKAQHRTRKERYREWLQRRKERDQKMRRKEKKRHDLMLQKQKLTKKEQKRLEKDRQRREKRERKRQKRLEKQQRKEEKRRSKLEKKERKRKQKALKKKKKRLERVRKREAKRERARDKREAKRKEAKLKRLQKQKKRLEKKRRKDTKGND